MNPKISIITAVYNRENSIANSLLSIKNQSYNNVECIVIDGASTDGTLEKIRNILVDGDCLISEPDHGIYDALNKGLSNASGDIIGFMHSDDIYVSNQVLEKIAEEFMNCDLDIIYGDASFFNPNNPTKITRKYSSGSFSKARLSWGRMPAHPSMFVKKRVYEKYGHFKTDYLIAADYEFLCRLFSDPDYKVKDKYIPEVFVEMALGGISTQGFKNTIILNKEVLRACLSNGIYTNYFKILSKYLFKFLEKFYK